MPRYSTSELACLLRPDLELGHWQIGFNLEVGGYFSIKRNTASIFGNTFLSQEQVVPYCKALLEVFRCGSRPPSTIHIAIPLHARSCFLGSTDNYS